MKNVDYKFWADYIKEIHSTIGSKDDKALELASGNCKLAKYLKSEFSLFILSDISLEMLKYNKSSHPLVCLDMTRQPFKAEFDFIFSTFDSVNYLKNERALNQFFTEIKTVLSNDGYFLFDVSLKRNSLKHIKQLNRKGKFKGIKYEQISEFDELESIHKNTIIMQKGDGEIIKEVHEQKIYDFYYYFDVLEKNRYYVSECFEAFTFKKANANSERVQFIVKGIN